MAEWISFSLYSQQWLSKDFAQKWISSEKIIWNQQNRGSPFQSVGIMPGFPYSGLCRAGAVRQYGDNMVMQTTEEGGEGEKIEFWSKLWKFCVTRSFVTFYHRKEGKLGRVLPSGRATCPPTLPKTTRKSRSFGKAAISILLLLTGRKPIFVPLVCCSIACPKVLCWVLGPMEPLVGPMEALLGPMEAPGSLSSSLETTLHWITVVGEPWLLLSSASPSQSSQLATFSESHQGFFTLAVIQSPCGLIGNCVQLDDWLAIVFSLLIDWSPTACRMLETAGRMW